MKKVKRMSLIMVIALIGSLLTGCVANVSKVKINGDGSGSCVIYSGVSKEAYDIIMEIAAEEEMDSSDDEMFPFTYNDVPYIGQTASFDFENIEELNETLLQNHNITEVDTGIISFSESEDGEITFVLSVTEDTGNTDALEEQTETFAAEVDEETQKQLEELLKSILLIFEIEFPEKVEQTTGINTEGITINDKNLAIDYIKLAESLNGKSETFTFVSTKTDKGDKSTNNAKEIAFTDVLEKDWCYNQIMSMVDMGLLNGKGNNLFCPDDTMTKAEFTTVAAKILYDKISLNLLPGNIDVWWDKYYNACVQNAVFTKEELKYESMTEGMQRQEMALVAFGLLKDSEGFDEIDVEEVGKNIPDFDEVDENLKESVAYCYYLGILCGADEKGSFNPESTLTRAEASTVIYRIVNPDMRILKSTEA